MTAGSPFSIAFQPTAATSAGSSFFACPTFVSSSSARWKNSVSVAPGLRHVTVTPLSLISWFSAAEKLSMKAFEPL